MIVTLNSWLDREKSAAWTALHRYRGKPDSFRSKRYSGIIPRIVAGSGKTEVRWLEPMWIFQVLRKSDLKWINIGFDMTKEAAIERLKNKVSGKEGGWFLLFDEGDVVSVGEAYPEESDSFYVEGKNSPKEYFDFDKCELAMCGKQEIPFARPISGMQEAISVKEDEHEFVTGIAPCPNLIGEDIPLAEDDERMVQNV